MKANLHRGFVSGLGFASSQWPLDETLPSLVFIHGAGGSSNFWENHVHGLSDRANTVAVDLPGRGNSPGPGSRNVGEYARRLISFVRELRPHFPVPVGFSMGGAVVLQMLVDAPQEFKAAVIISTGAKLGVAPAVLELIENDFETYISQVGKTAASPKTDPALFADAIADRASCDPSVVLGDFEACNAFDIRDRLPEIGTEVLIISASDDILTPPRYADYLEERLTRARRVHIDDAGHFVALEQSSQVDLSVRDFLDNLDK